MENENKNMTPPEPPKDENGKPLPPPKGGRPPQGDRPEPPKDENGNPLPPPENGEAPKPPAADESNATV